MIESHYPFTLLSLTAVISAGIFSSAAFSQSTESSPSANRADTSLPQITIEASHQVHKKQVGMSYTGIPIEEVTLHRHVAYQDLKLNTSAGAAELDERIEATAQEACNQLKTLYPLDMAETDNRQCVRDAVQGAMQQAKNLEANRQNNS
jgi:UrcA family protein